MNSRRFFLIGCLVAVGTAAGCGGRSTPSTDENLPALARMYGRFRGQHRGRAPADEKEFKAWINAMPADQRMGITDVEKLFVSPRTGEPYVVLYGKQAPANTMPGGVPVPPPGGAGAPPSDPLLAHEKSSENGKRFVVFVSGIVESVDDERFQQLSGQ